MEMSANEERRQAQKRDVIVISDDEDSPNDQQPEKRVKVEAEASQSLPHTPFRAPSTPQDANSLRRDAAKWKIMYQRQCDSAEKSANELAEAEGYMQHMESLIETKDAELAELSKQLEEAKISAGESKKKEAEVAKQLDDAAEEWKKKEGEWEQEKDILVNANFILKRREEKAITMNEVLAMEVAALKKQLEEATVQGDNKSSRELELVIENEALKTAVDKLRRRLREEVASTKIGDLSRENEALKDVASAWKRKEEEAVMKIDELKEQLEEYKRNAEIDGKRMYDLADSVAHYKEQLQVKQEQQQPFPRLQLHERTESKNIFRLCFPNAFNTISLDQAVRDIQLKMEELRIVGGSVDYGKEFKHRKLTCEACLFSCAKYDVLAHFLSQEHYKKVDLQGAAVSRTAYLLWMDALTKACSTAVDAVAAAAAPAATTGFAAAVPMQQPTSQGAGMNSAQQVAATAQDEMHRSAYEARVAATMPEMQPASQVNGMNAEQPVAATSAALDEHAYAARVASTMPKMQPASEANATVGGAEQEE